MKGSEHMTVHTVNPHLVLPLGTQVVTRIAVKTTGGVVLPRGAVGVIVTVPDRPDIGYEVRFPDGIVSMFTRDQLSIRKQVQQDVLGAENVAHEPLFGYVIYRCIIGSRAYELDGPDSDIDRRGIFLPPARLQWSMAGVPHFIERPATEEAYWELQRFLELALKANPNVLECLWTPLVEFATPLAHELLAMRDAFLSQLIYQTYNGYVMSQFKKLEADVRTSGTIKWKHAMHLVRLLLAGITVLEEGTVPLGVAAHRDQLLAIRRGELPWEEINAWRLSLHQRFDAALATTHLPSRPDTERVNAFLVKARRSMVEEET